MVDEHDRVEQMKRYLDEHADEIERWDFGHVHFDWNPGDIKTHLGQSGRIGQSSGKSGLSRASRS